MGPHCEAPTADGQPVRTFRIERLKRRGDFLRVARAQKKWAAPGLILQVRAHPADGEPAREDGLLRVGFTVSRKVGNAVRRNRAKRRLRALAAEVLPTHARAGFDLVIIGRYATPVRPWDKLKGDLLKALDKMAVSPSGAPTSRDTASHDTASEGSR